MSKRDEKIAKAEADAKRQKKKSCKPPDNYGDNYVTGMEKLRTQGKGDSYRVLEGWYSDETKKKFDKIFKKRQKEWEQNTTTTIPPEFDEEGSGTIPPEFDEDE